MECNCLEHQESMCKKAPAGFRPNSPIANRAGLSRLRGMLWGQVITARWWHRQPTGSEYRRVPDKRGGIPRTLGFRHHLSSPAAVCKRGKPAGLGGPWKSCGDCKAKSGFVVQTSDESIKSN